MDLWKVRGNGCVLYFPKSLPQSDLLRGGTGYVVDLDAPCEREWCADQMHKLEPAPEAKEADRIINRAALAEIAKARAAGPVAPKSETLQPVGAAAGESATSGSDPLEVRQPARARKAG